MATSLRALLNTLPQIGQVRWIGLRPSHKRLPSGRVEKQAMLSVAEVNALADQGLEGDRYSRGGKRQVTLIQWEHLAVMAALLGRAQLDPALLRRNIAVAGVNLLALKGKRFYLGEALLEYTGLCEPCSAMEDKFGPGGYNIVRGHGGITARIIHSGCIRLNDSLHAVPADDL